MKTSKIFFFLFLLTVSVFITSCDPGVKYDRIIQNSSTHDIIIYGYGIKVDSNSIDSFYVDKYSVKSIMQYSYLGTISNFEDCSFNYDSLSAKIMDSDSLNLLLDLNDQANWNFNVIDESFGGGGSCECRLIINDDQIK